MSSDDGTGDPIEDLREHRSTINLINCALMALKDVDRDTHEIEHRLHEMLGQEIYEIRVAIDHFESAEDAPEAS